MASIQMLAHWESFVSAYRCAHLRRGESRHRGDLVQRHQDLIEHRRLEHSFDLL